LDVGDLNKSALSTIAISCIFTKFPDEVVVDANYPTSLQKEFLTNTEGYIEIRKEFKIQATVGKPSVSLVANHPTKEGYANLHSLKISELKALGIKLGVDKLVTDQRASSLWRKAIWESQSDLECKLVQIQLNDLGSESKDIYSKIEQLLPTYALFRSDRESSDLDPEAKNPLQAAVKQAQKELQAEILALQGKVEQSVIDVATRTLEKIREMDPNLASELTPRFKESPKWTFNFTLDSDNGIPMNKRGSGARRLILLNFFRAEAEKKQKESGAPNVIYAIEEPETSQHPNYQMMLIESLLRLSERPECQILVTTHVPALAGLLPTESIRFVSKDDNGLPVVNFGSEDVLADAATSLGVLPDSNVAGSSGVLLVEGFADVAFVHHAAEMLKESGMLKVTLKESRIAVIPIGGCGNLKHWVTRRLVDQLGLNWSILLDSDLGGPKREYEKNLERIREVKALGKLGILTKKREPENYIDRKLVQEHCGFEVDYSDTCDAKKIIGAATQTKEDRVLEKFWVLMDAEMILQNSAYVEDGVDKYELLEILESVLRTHNAV
jgi:predicted ATP-dependent endonuclease of OLD family